MPLAFHLLPSTVSQPYSGGELNALVTEFNGVGIAGSIPCIAQAVDVTGRETKTLAGEELYSAGEVKALLIEIIGGLKHG